jgi:hypothetical protein
VFRNNYARVIIIFIEPEIIYLDNIYRMVYSQTKKTASIASITNQYQGGGNNKPGLFPQIGRSSWTSVAYNANGIPMGQCCKVSDLKRLNFTSFSRPIGSASYNTYFKIK